MKHVKPSTKSILAKADMKATPMEIVELDPCLGLTGWELDKCRKQNPS